LVLTPKITDSHSVHAISRIILTFRKYGRDELEVSRCLE
jgi:hypothetical protein